jgi:hypothetical protein
MAATFRLRGGAGAKPSRGIIPETAMTMSRASTPALDGVAPLERAQAAVELAPDQA